MSSSPLTVEVIPIVNTIGGTSTNTTLVDSNFLSVSANSYWNNYVVIAGSLEDDATTTNLTPSVATLSGDLVTRVTDGICGLKSVAGSVIQSTYLDMTLRMGIVTNSFTSYINNTIADKTSDVILSMLSTRNSSSYFTTVNNTSAIYVKNLSSWAAGIDLAPISVATDCLGVWAKRNNATLITRRHIIGAKHWNVYYPSYAAAAGWIPGSKIRFVDSNNEVHTRTVLGVTYVSDIVVGTLDSDIPESITPMKVMGNWFTRNRTTVGGNFQYYIGGLAFHINQSYNCNFVLFGSLGNSLAAKYSTTINGTPYILDGFQGCYTKSVINGISPFPSFLSGGYMNYYDTAHGGDSGNPLMVVLSGSPVLLWTWWYETGGPPVWTSGFLNSMIAEADSNSSVSTGYTVTEASNPL